MQKGCLVSLLLAVGLLLFAGLFGVSTYNGMVSKQERIEASAAQIDNVCQRRADLIPNLVATVQGAADFEQETLSQVTEARAAVARTQLPADVVGDPEAMQAYLAAQDQLGSALGRLFAVSESYPQLRATESFLSLQDQLEGSENRIATARNDYIEAVEAYNGSLRRFPGNLIAGAAGFERAATFEAEPEAREVPTVDFGDGEG